MAHGSMVELPSGWRMHADECRMGELELGSHEVQVLALPDVRERMAGDGLTVVGDTPEQFAAFLATETARAARIIKAAGISVGQ